MLSCVDNAVCHLGSEINTYLVYSIHWNSIYNSLFLEYHGSDIRNNLAEKVALKEKKSKSERHYQKRSNLFDGNNYSGNNLYSMRFKLSPMVYSGPSHIMYTNNQSDPGLDNSREHSFSVSTLEVR